MVILTPDDFCGLGWGAPNLIESVAKRIVSAMTRAAERQIEVLNGLIAITLDSVEGYATAGSNVEQIHLKTLYDTRTTQRRQLIAKLQAEVLCLGGEARDQGSFLAAGHRMLLFVTHAITRSDRCVLDDVERCEGYLMDRYEVALQDGSLTDTVSAILTKAFERIKDDYGFNCDLRHQFAADDFIGRSRIVRLEMRSDRL